jgi:hypothetical protein
MALGTPSKPGSPGSDWLRKVQIDTRQSENPSGTSTDRMIQTQQGLFLNNGGARSLYIREW